MNKQIIKKYFTGLIIFFIAATIFKWVAGEQLEYKIRTIEMTEVNNTIGELADGVIIQERFISRTDTLQKIALLFCTYGRQNTGQLDFSLKRADGTSVFQEHIDASVLEDGWYEITLGNQVKGLQGEILLLEIKGGSPSGFSPSLYYNDWDNGEGEMSVNDQPVNGSIGYKIEGRIYYLLGPFYWHIVLIIAFCGTLYSIFLYYCSLKGRKNWILVFINVYKKYHFLIVQLVARDFKTKYKRSVLGYLWSFLNPLLTMGVQYIVFSTIFKNGVENFPVYLLSGVVFFNFFTEAVGLGLTSIVGNASLITKVYVPKYIYPVTRVLSSTINLVISLIPLFLLTLLTGTKLTQAVILLVIPVSCVLIFSIGMALALSASMVFFRDTQYLWGIVSMAWMYLTPLFYPINILPAKFQVILQWNPMNRIINFVRIILIQGKSPEPIDYLVCIFFSFGMLLIGAWIFKKNQDKFVLYL